MRIRFALGKYVYVTDGRRLRRYNIDMLNYISRARVREISERIKKILKN